MLKVERLRCEYLENPSDRRKPGLADLASKEKMHANILSIQVSKSKTAFENPYWDSGVVSSDN